MNVIKKEEKFILTLQKVVCYTNGFLTKESIVSGFAAREGIVFISEIKTKYKYSMSSISEKNSYQ